MIDIQPLRLVSSPQELEVFTRKVEEMEGKCGGYPFNLDRR